MSDPAPSSRSASALPSGWGPSAALAGSRGGGVLTSKVLTSSRVSPLFVFLIEAALNQVCGVATPDKRLDKKLDGI